ncbi:MAG: hypothetical protein R3190_10495, partial [Thermoanaerobaculia bacterium]|nr:hypothetical protein [Thermoanaerobaculia bacterium]
QLRSERLDEIRRARPSDVPTEETYLIRGEYGRILSSFCERFPRSQMLVLFSEDLDSATRRTVGTVFDYLSVDETFTPENLRKRYHEGGTRERFPNLVSYTKRVAPLRWLWRLLPRERRRAAWTWFFTEGNVRSQAPSTLPASLRRDLAEFYKDDVARLVSLVGRPVPWEDYSGLGE